MHFVNASQIGPRKFIGTLGGQNKNPELRSPLKGRRTKDPPNEGCCTKAVAWFHIIVYLSLVVVFIYMVVNLIFGKYVREEIEANPEKYAYFYNLKNSEMGLKALTLLFALCLVGSVVGLVMSIVLLNAEKERNICRLKIWIIYTIIICCIVLPCYMWQLNEGPIWGFIVLFTMEIIFLWIVVAFIRKIQTTPLPAPDALITEV